MVGGDGRWLVERMVAGGWQWGLSKVVGGDGRWLVVGMVVGGWRRWLMVGKDGWLKGLSKETGEMVRGDGCKREERT